MRRSTDGIALSVTVRLLLFRYLATPIKAAPHSHCALRRGKSTASAGSTAAPVTPTLEEALQITALESKTFWRSSSFASFLP